MKPLLPVFLHLESVPVLLVGGRASAREKLHKLLPAGAALTVIARSFDEATLDLLRRHGATWAVREVQPSDIAGQRLLISAVDDAAEHSRLAELGRAAGVLVNTVDAPASCDFYFAAQVQRGPLQLAISTSGLFPGVASAIRTWLEHIFPEDLQGELEELVQLRRRVQQRLPDPRLRMQALRDQLRIWIEQDLSKGDPDMSNTVEATTTTGEQLVEPTGSNAAPPPAPTKSKAELLKEESTGLRGTLVSDVLSDAGRFGNQSETLLKFHGIYQQKDRDRRRPDEPAAGPKPFTLMVRGRIPGGRLTAAQWLAWDEVATRHASSGLRLTTRQSLQLHGVLKQELKATIKEINDALISTTGACGDVVRNVTEAVNPRGEPRLAQLPAVSDLLSKHFEVESNAYFEIFLDGQPVVEAAPDRIYGTAYLPRKFKIGLTVAGNNSIDIYTQDLGLAATFTDAGQLDGYFVFVGGGMGMSHGDGATHPRLADLLGWTPASHLLQVTEAVVTTQRDHGNREDRTFARLKYLIDKQGLAWFKQQVEERSGSRLQERPLPPWRTPAYLGWQQHSDGSLSLGFHLLSGRVIDRPGHPLKTALRHLIGTYRLSVQMTPDQDVILLGIKPSDQMAIEAYLADVHLSALSPNRLYDRALTCVALPTCSKALAEAERVGPEVFGWLQASLDRHQLNDRAPIVRITGCPNGCARPYAAELGLVGQMPGQYAVYIGGDSEGLRLATKVKDKVKIAELPELFERLAQLWASKAQPDERLGDFAVRYGLPRLGDEL